jgi:uncharacterized membrane protein
VTAEYNRFAGRSVERVQTLSDGIFAVAMTLLVLDLRLPGGSELHSDRELRDSLWTLGPNFAAYALSFTMLGTFWAAQHTLLGLCRRGDRALTWLQLFFLLVVTLLPFSASLLAENDGLRLAVGVYWLNILLLGVALAASSSHVASADLLDSGAEGRLRVFRRRIVVAQVAYTVAAAVCLLNTYASVLALAVVQVYFIVSPRWRFLDGLLLQRPGDADD